MLTYDRNPNGISGRSEHVGRPTGGCTRGVQGGYLPRCTGGGIYTVKLTFTHKFNEFGWKSGLRTSVETRQKPDYSSTSSQGGPKATQKDTLRCKSNGFVPESGLVAVLQTLGYSPCEATFPLKTVNNVSQTVKVFSGDGKHLRINLLKMSSGAY